MSFITTKFHAILSSGFIGVALTRKTVVSFILTKNGVTLRKKVETKLSVDIHIYTLCPSLL